MSHESFPSWIFPIYQTLLICFVRQFLGRPTIVTKSSRFTAVFFSTNRCLTRQPVQRVSGKVYKRLGLRLNLFNPRRLVVHHFPNFYRVESLKFGLDLWRQSPWRAIWFQRKQHIGKFKKIVSVYLWLAYILPRSWSSSVPHLWESGAPENEPGKSAKFSITQPRLTRLCWNLICRCVMGSQGCGIVEFVRWCTMGLLWAS